MAHLLVLRGAIGAGKSSAARTLACRRSSTKVLEVDDIKLLRYGTTETCIPAEDFPLAGRWARYYLDRNVDVVLVEPFCKKEELFSALEPTGRRPISNDATMVWLDCSVETSIDRKIREHDEPTIRSQHERYRDRYTPHGEKVITTDGRTTDEVVDEISDIIDTKLHFGLETTYVLISPYQKFKVYATT